MDEGASPQAMIEFLSVLALTFLLSCLLTWVLCKPGSRFYVLDHPNERSLHTRPTPRSGGLAILSAASLGVTLGSFWFGFPVFMYWIGLATALMAIVSYWDDRHGILVWQRFSIHLFAAGLVILGTGFSLRILELPGVAWELSYQFGLAFALVFLVWMANLYNFMDGMDGFAGGMTVFGFGTFAIFGMFAEQPLFATFNLVVAAAASGFLIFNFPPARIFMGDIGSSTLGLLVAGFSLWGTRDGIFPLWIALLVFSPFIVDATVTLIRRLFQGEKVWQAHKTHYYQRLVQLGWGHRKTVLWEYALMASCAVSAIWTVRQTEAVQWVVIGFWIIAYVALIAMVHRLEMKNSQLRMDYRT